jgi:D-amino peptidase
VSEHSAAGPGPEGLKVFISCDLEGVAGVVDWEQCRESSPAFEPFARLLTGEVNAAIEGAAAAGATRFVVNDSHGRMANLRPDELAGGASYLSGRYKPRYMMEGLDRSFDAVFFVGYHGSMGARASVLSHTYFPGAFAEVRINGEVCGESGLNALVAMAAEVPVVLVSGDDVTAGETERFCPGVRSAVVKRSVSRFAAESLHPERSRQLIRAEAEAAIRALPAAPRVAIDLPATITATLRTSDYADLASRIGGVARTGDLTISLGGDDPAVLFDTFVTVVLLCRGLVE